MHLCTDGSMDTCTPVQHHMHKYINTYIHTCTHRQKLGYRHTYTYFAGNRWTCRCGWMAKAATSLCHAMTRLLRMCAVLTVGCACTCLFVFVCICVCVCVCVCVPETSANNLRVPTCNSIYVGTYALAHVRVYSDLTSSREQICIYACVRAYGAHITYKAAPHADGTREFSRGWPNYYTNSDSQNA
jgi:hypothetical protein